MVQRARQQAAAAGTSADRLRYTVADVAYLPHADASVDLVVSSLSLHLWADVPAGLTEVRRVLKPGGAAWIYDVKGVLTRVASRATMRGVDLTVEPIARPRQADPVRRRLLAHAAALFLGRLRLQG